MLRCLVSRGKLLQHLAKRFLIFQRDFWLRRTRFLISFRDLGPTVLNTVGPEGFQEISKE